MSREIQVPPQELEDWRRVFLESGSRGLKRSGRDPTERELSATASCWIRTLKEECLYLHDFETLDEARQVIGASIER